MKIKEIGEFGLINRFSPDFLKDLPEQTFGIGDDCAVLPLNQKESMLITTDMLIEDSHFLRHRILPEDLGYKSLAVNLSDIAAMGGIPAGAFLSIGIPSDIEVEWLDLFFAGLHSLGQETGTHLLGGDTTRSQKHLIINIVVVGKMQTSNIKYRSAAKPGDEVYLTGFVGDSGTGLKIIMDKKPLDASNRYLINEHNRPRPHLEEGQWLANRNSVHAMIDVSDGIDSDLRHIMDKSQCGVDINLKSLPVSDQMLTACRQHNWNSYELAATGGEDYCLLCTIAKKDGKKIAREFELKFGRAIYPVGRITTNSHKLNYFYNQKSVHFREHGFDHFI